ncbi:9129_t:CDS:2, partial [Scutellospora calospora]
YWNQFDILTYLLCYFLYPKYRKIIKAMVKDNNLFEDNDNKDFSNNSCENIDDNDDETNLNNLIIRETINLDFFDFQENETTVDISNQIYSRNKNIEDEDFDINFEKIYEEEFER